MYYYSTSIIIMQYPTEDNQDDQFPYLALAWNESDTKKVPLLPSSHFEPSPIYLPKGPSYTSKCTIVTKKYDINGLCIQERLNGSAWLKETISNKLSDVLLKSLSKSHAEKERVKSDIHGINVTLRWYRSLYIHWKLSIAVCCTKNTITFLNPNQTSLDVCDQPVYALTKKNLNLKTWYLWKWQIFFFVGWLWSGTSGACLLYLHGKLVKGNYLYEILAIIFQSFVRSCSKR